MDIVFARALEKALKGYSSPKYLQVPQHHQVVFRDEEDFTGAEYNQSLMKLLEKSEKVLVVCLPMQKSHPQLESWKEEYNRTLARGYLGNFDVAVKLDSHADFTVKGVSFDPHTVAKVAAKATIQGLLIGA